MDTLLELGIEGQANMDRDREMLSRAEHGGVAARVYTWDGPWVSLGRFQNPARALKSPDSISWTMRPTGGKAVLHGHDVTVSIAANLNVIGLGVNEAKRVSTVYRAVISPLIEAMTEAGLPAVLAEKTLHVRNAGHTSDCFAHVSPNDIVDPETGDKVCGCALRVTDSAVLLQASIPVTVPLVDPFDVFDNPHVLVRTRALEPETLARTLRTKSPRQYTHSVY